MVETKIRLFETKIKFQGKEKTIAFGSWVVGEVAKIARKGEEAGFETFASIIFYGLIWGEKLYSNFTAGEKLPFDIFDCYDWIDEVGGINSEEFKRIQNLWDKHTELYVPKDEKKKK